MAGVNKVILVGNLGIDPEIKSFENGSKVARLRIATTESYTNKDGQRVDQTEWHTVTLWRHLAELAEKYLSKGKQVYVEGKLRTRTWKDSDGNDRYSTEIEAATLQMLGNRPVSGDSTSQERQSGAVATTQSIPAQSTTSDQDDLPF
jgi:single-strand DNA-binding protein